ncbi:MAG: phenylalanine--tRNA ligase subunit alpha [Elusimicrobiota bacterium]
MISVDKYQEIKEEFISDIKNCTKHEEAERIKTKYLGRKGLVNTLFKEIKNLPLKEKPEWGKKINSLKQEIESELKKKKDKLKKSSYGTKFFDPTVPAYEKKYPKTHPVIKGINEIIDIFISMGFGVAYGPEIETNYYNFTALNFPPSHPARDAHDTFYLKNEERILRTHTSPVQVRAMEKNDPPYKFIAPGKCYRRDTIDASHFPMFHQVEGLLVDEKVNFSDLKGVLQEFACRYFTEETKPRFRPSYFPFTEPSAEMDIMCTSCKGKGCPLCSYKGWLEILGAGMVDPEVFRYSEVDPEKWQGFAFGMGVERMVMLKYGINDMRLLYKNDLRFLEQF